MGSLTLDTEISLSHIRRQDIWNNTMIRGNKKVLFIKLWYDKGIIKLSDLLDKNGNICTFFQLRNKYKFEYNFVEFYSVKTAIPHNWKNNILKCLEADLTAQEEMIKNIMKVTKICRYIHNLSVQQVFSPPKSIDKWNSLFNIPNIDWANIFLVPVRSCLSTRSVIFSLR